MKQTEIHFNMHLHVPYGNYPRQTFAGEQAYYEVWKHLAPTSLHHMLVHSPYEVDERTSRIVASFMCWLGTNCGQSFMWNAKQLANQLGSLERGYFISWCLENKREFGVNHNVRALEGITQLDDLTAQDYEIIEYAAQWLATDDGQEYIKSAELLIPEYKSRIKMMSALKGEYCGY